MVWHNTGAVAYGRGLCSVLGFTGHSSRIGHRSLTPQSTHRSPWSLALATLVSLRPRASGIGHLRLAPVTFVSHRPPSSPIGYLRMAPATFVSHCPTASRTGYLSPAPATFISHRWPVRGEGGQCQTKVATVFMNERKPVRPMRHAPGAKSKAASRARYVRTELVACSFPCSWVRPMRGRFKIACRVLGPML